MDQSRHQRTPAGIGDCGIRWCGYGLDNLKKKFLDEHIHTLGEFLVLAVKEIDVLKQHTLLLRILGIGCARPRNKVTRYKKGYDKQSLHLELLSSEVSLGLTNTFTGESYTSPDNHWASLRMDQEYGNLAVPRPVRA
jgi:hypothetical protein